VVHFIKHVLRFLPIIDEPRVFVDFDLPYLSVLPPLVISLLSVRRSASAKHKRPNLRTVMLPPHEHIAVKTASGEQLELRDISDGVDQVLMCFPPVNLDYIVLVKCNLALLVDTCDERSLVLLRLLPRGGDLLLTHVGVMEFFRLQLIKLIDE